MLKFFTLSSLRRQGSTGWKAGYQESSAVVGGSPTKSGMTVGAMGCALIFLFLTGEVWAACVKPNGEGVEGEIIYNRKWKVMQYCNGDDWVGMGMMTGVSVAPSGAIMAFDLAECPTGWSAYTAAQGRFLRGIDPSGTVDPDGVRVAGDVQVDAMQRITGEALGYSTSSGFFQPYRSSSGAFDVTSSGGAGRIITATTATSLSGGLRFNSGDSPDAKVSDVETRPVNVAVLYCRKD